MTRLRARASRGERAYGRMPRNRGSNTTLPASMGAGGMGPSRAVIGSTKKAVFETYVEEEEKEVLAPSYCRGARRGGRGGGTHRGGRLCGRGFLPPHPPDYSAIEEAFSKIKALLCARPRLRKGGTWWRPWAGRSRRSPRRTRRVSSAIAPTRSALHHHEHRYEPSGAAVPPGRLLSVSHPTEQEARSRR